MEVEAVVVVEETAWVETDLEEVVDDLDSVVEAVVVDGLDLQEVSSLHHSFFHTFDHVSLIIISLNSV